MLFNNEKAFESVKLTAVFRSLKEQGINESFIKD